MTHTNSFLLVTLCCLSAACGQSGLSADAPLVGCYEVVSLDWSPPDVTIRLIPMRFQLLNEPIKYGTKIWGFEVKSFPVSLGNMIEGSWQWKPRGNRVWISWGTGFGGFRGTLKPSSTGEFVGKLKEWCDHRCGWKKRVGTIRVRKIQCAE